MWRLIKRILAIHAIGAAVTFAIFMVDDIRSWGNWETKAIHRWTAWGFLATFWEVAAVGVVLDRLGILKN